MKKIAYFFLLCLFFARPAAAARVAVLPASGIAGNSESYRLLVSDVTFPASGKIVFEFSAAFDLSPVRSVKAFAREDSLSLFQVSRFDVKGQKIEITFRHQLPASLQTILIELNKIQNGLRAGESKIAVWLSHPEKENEVVSLPSEAFFLLPGPPVKQRLEPIPSVLKAGESVELKAVAEDRFGNPTEAISANWRISSAFAGGGNLVGNRFFATRSGSVEVVAENDGLVPVSASLLITSGTLDTFVVTGTPESTVAGVHFPEPVGNVTVVAKDQFGNTITNFNDTVFFSSDDPQVALPVPYRFTVGDNGTHTFPGSSFVLKTAGNKLISVSSKGKAGSSQPISVRANAIADFLLLAPPDAIAGKPFNAAVAGAVDLYGNTASGNVTVSASSGGGASPDGTFPNFTPIVIVSGAGQSPQTLVAATPTVLRGSTGTVNRQSNSIAVRPGDLGSFDFVLTSPQISGVPLTQPAHLFARDRFDNLKTDFDASADSVTLSANPSGTWVNNVLKQSSDFTLGVTDLNALGAAFFGPAGTYIFSASSQSGKTGSTQPVEVRSIFVDSFVLSPKNLIRGENFTLAFRVANQSPAVFVLDEVKLLAASRSVLFPLPTLPDTLAVSQRRSYSSSASIPVDFPLGQFPVQLELLGRYGTTFTTVKTPVLDFLSVADSLFLRPAANSLNFDQVSKGRLYPFTVRLVNQSSFDVILDSTSRLVFQGGGFSKSFELAGASTIYQNSESQISFKPDSFPSSFPSAPFPAALVLFGRRDGISVSDSFSLADTVILQSRSRVFYVAGSITPKTGLLKPPLTFELEVGDSGETVFEPDSTSRLLLVRVQDTLTGRPGGPNQFNQSSARLNFEINQIPADAEAGYWRPWLVLSGMENGLSTSFNLAVSDSVQLFTQPRLVLDSLWNGSPSRARANSDLPVPVRFELFNPSAESLLATSVVLYEGSAALDSVEFPLLSPAQKVTGSLIVPANANHLGMTAYRLEIRPGRGKASSAMAEVDAPVDQISILRQRKALLDLQPRIVSPPNAVQGTLLAGQTLTLAFDLSNLGEAPVGAGHLRLRAAPPFLTFISDSIASITSTQPAVFQLLVQDTTDSVRVTADWFAVPLDSNAASPADLVSGSVGLSFKIRVALGGLEVSVRESSSPLIFSGLPQFPLTLGFKNIDLSGLHTSILKGISIRLSGAKPSDVFDEAMLVTSGGTIPALFRNDSLVFNFSNPVLLGAGEAQDFTLSLKLKNRDAGSLRFFTNAEMIQAFDSVPGSPAVPAVLLKEGGQPFAYASPVFTTSAGSGLAATLVTYPNPFSPPAEKMQIAYRLSAASEVELKIYTLTGELVAERTYSSGSVGGQPGVNQIEWDGRNDKGKEIKNGVYLAVIRSKATGEVVKQKLAVVR